jgi:hypothetical protein
LPKGREQARLGAGLYSSPRVDHIEPRDQDVVLTCPGQLQTDLSVLGELDRVVGEVDQNLAQRAAVARNLNPHRWSEDHQREPLVLGERVQPNRHLFQQLLAVDRTEIQLKLP